MFVQRLKTTERTQMKSIRTHWEFELVAVHWGCGLGGGTLVTLTVASLSFSPPHAAYSSSVLPIEQYSDVWQKNKKKNK